MINLKTWVPLTALVLFSFFGVMLFKQTDPRVHVSACLASNTEEMVYVPGGTFLMGGAGIYADEGPAQEVTIKPFYMDSTEVTNAQFSEFVNATGYVTVAERIPSSEDYPDIPQERLRPGSAVFVPPTDAQAGGSFLEWWQFKEGANWRQPDGPDSSVDGRETYPVVHVAHSDALAYAVWRGHRLPTEAEYEFAARGGLENTRYGWGDELVPDDLYMANTWQGFFPISNSADDGYVGLAPVGCYQANPYGLYDLIGNVWEWTSDPYYPSHLSSESDTAPKDGYDPRLPGLPVRVIKGGSYLCAPNYCMRYRPAARHAQDTGLGTNHIGFRTVKSLNN